MPAQWGAYRSRRGRLSPRELVLTVLLGGALGLAVPQWQEGWKARPEVDPLVELRGQKADPWERSRESERILREQEGVPEPVSVRHVEQVLGGTVSVVDGDTFWYRGDKIRVADIDAPETHPPRCPYEAELGERATRRLAALLGAGPFELQAIDRDRDRYGRKLRVVVRDGQSLGEVLVAEGLARQWAGARRPWCV